MYFKSPLAATLLVASHMASLTTACSPSTLSIRNDNSTGPPITWGPDTPSDPATAGYFLNHFSINVKNLTATLDFYSRAFGLRHIFTVQASEHLSIAYMGHSQGGRNGTGYQTTAELNRDKNNAAGLVEMIYFDIPDKSHLQASSVRTNTFGHMGVIVPDVEAAQARLEALPGVRILKRFGAPTESEGEVAIANGFPPEALAQVSAEERATIAAVLSVINERFLYVADPDGNIIEVQPQD
ncbi:unnamed protein product [Clonostachys rhizophaga]|uniref:VOC domain-containing protein n=1 Tax=Clonostachys rhizophaga TaxID=160324 RepID=A0A9N9VYP7_9HYPO|nr:unnamed protein product [Clonostachys rhizophaga]